MDDASHISTPLYCDVIPSNYFKRGIRVLAHFPLHSCVTSTRGMLMLSERNSALVAVGWEVDGALGMVGGGSSELRGCASDPGIIEEELTIAGP